MEEKGTKKLQGMKEYDFTDKWVPSENYSSLQSHFLFEQHVIKIPKRGNDLWGIASPSIIQG